MSDHSITPPAGAVIPDQRGCTRDRTPSPRTTGPGRATRRPEDPPMRCRGRRRGRRPCPTTGRCGPRCGSCSGCPSPRRRCARSCRCSTRSPAAPRSRSHTTTLVTHVRPGPALARRAVPGRAAVARARARPARGALPQPQRRGTAGDRAGPVRLAARRRPGRGPRRRARRARAGVLPARVPPRDERAHRGRDDDTRVVDADPARGLGDVQRDPRRGHRARVPHPPRARSWAGGRGSRSPAAPCCAGPTTSTRGSAASSATSRWAPSSPCSTAAGTG